MIFLLNGRRGLGNLCLLVRNPTPQPQRLIPSSQYFFVFRSELSIAKAPQSSYQLAGVIEFLFVVQAPVMTSIISEARFPRTPLILIKLIIAG